MMKSKKKILFVGEHFRSSVGNGNMLAALLSQVDTEKYDIACFCARDVDPIDVLFRPDPFTTVNATTTEDFWGHARLLSLLQRADLDILCFVGIDIWQYHQIWRDVIQLRNARKFKIVFIFPYDVNHLRLDWLGWINDCDIPCVYSHYGVTVLKDHVPALRYFRPPLWNSKLFKPLPNRMQIRKTCFPTVPDDYTIFGFVGVNQIRKSPERMLKAFMEAKRENPKMTLYLHTDLTGGLHNLRQMAKDFGAKPGDLVQKNPGVYPPEKMADIYNGMDCLVNCSMQEGLSWTPLEAMLCGTPMILSDTTAQTELGMGVAEMVPCNDLAFVPMVVESGKSEVEAKACKVPDIKRAMLKVAADPELRTSMSEKGIERGRKWLAGVNNINDVLGAATSIKPLPKIQSVLFAQHSSAGDVLMTTQCFKGIKERHLKLPLVYMTQKVYQDIVTGNPYIDEIIDWDEKLLKRYQVVYSPHKDHILSGGFNSLDVTLHSMYPYFCKVDADDIHIIESIPDLSPFCDFVLEHVIPKGGLATIKMAPYIVVHTTGGSKKYRSYPHMDVALKGIGLPVVQIGGLSDIRCKSDLDLCGKLTFRESAWVMKHAKAAVVIDSFLSHLAGAVGTDAVVLYGPAPSRVVGPKPQGCRIINIQPNMLDVCSKMTHCWGENPQCNSPCIHTISPMAIRKALKELL